MLFLYLPENLTRLFFKAKAKQIITFVIIFLPGLFVSIDSKSQDPVKQRSTLSIGSSNKISQKEKKYFIEQSIGQTSVIGSYQSEGHRLFQGYIQPLINANGLKKQDQDNTKLGALIYPNPTLSNITISFTETIEELLNVNLTDMLDQTMYCNKFGASPEIQIDLSNLKPGLYLVKISTGIKYIVIKLVKK